MLYHVDMLFDYVFNICWFVFGLLIIVLCHCVFSLFLDLCYFVSLFIGFTCIRLLIINIIITSSFMPIHIYVYDLNCSSVD